MTAHGPAGVGVEAYDFWLPGLLEYPSDHRLGPTTFDHGPKSSALEICILPFGGGVVRELTKDLAIDQPEWLKTRNRKHLSSPNLFQANIVLGLIVHIENCSHSEPDGLFDRLNIATKGMNVRVDEPGYNGAVGFAVCGSLCRDGCLA